MLASMFASMGDKTHFWNRSVLLDRQSLGYGEEASPNTLPMYHIHEYCASNNHAYFEKSPNGLDPTKILQALVQSPQDLLILGKLTKTPAKLINKIVTGAAM